MKLLIFKSSSNSFFRIWKESDVLFTGMKLFFLYFFIILKIIFFIRTFFKSETLVLIKTSKL